MPTRLQGITLRLAERSRSPPCSFTPVPIRHLRPGSPGAADQKCFEAEDQAAAPALPKPLFSSDATTATRASNNTSATHQRNPRAALARLTGSASSSTRSESVSTRQTSRSSTWSPPGTSLSSGVAAAPAETGTGTSLSPQLGLATSPPPYIALRASQDGARMPSDTSSGSAFPCEPNFSPPIPQSAGGSGHRSRARALSLRAPG